MASSLFFPLLQHCTCSWQTFISTAIRWEITTSARAPILELFLHIYSYFPPQLLDSNCWLMWKYRSVSKSTSRMLCHASSLCWLNSSWHRDSSIRDWQPKGVSPSPRLWGPCSHSRAHASTAAVTQATRKRQATTSSVTPPFWTVAVSSVCFPGLVCLW